jgi:hypothetical protein
MNPFHDFERRIDRLMRQMFGGKPDPGRGKEIIEIQRSILEAIRDRIHSLPRARRSFPFNDVVVRIPVADPERKAALEAVFVADDALQHEIRDFLRREQAEFPNDLAVRVTLVEATEITEPSVLCSTRETAVTPVEIAVAPGREGVRVAMPDGGTIELTKARIHVGRYAEVLDDRRRLVRRNDVVIENATVSRAHAHIEFDPASGAYRLFDDGSSYGTSAIHDGRLIDVPKAGARGLKLHSGDEIYFGQARVRFEVID